MNNSEKIVKAFTMAFDAHEEQKRDDGIPYIQHPLKVLKILADEFGVTDADTLCAALLHDTVEDTDMSYREIQEGVGLNVEAMVLTLTKTGMTKEEYYTSITSASRNVQLIKCADRLDNIRDMKTWTDKHKLKYIAETRKFVLPIAKALGEPVYSKLVTEVARYA